MACGFKSERQGRDERVAQPRQRVREAVKRSLPLFSVVLTAFVLTGCGDQVRPASVEEIAAFETAVPPGPSIDIDRIVRAKIATGPYRVVPGDTLQVEMLNLFDAQSLRDVTAASTQEFRYRVDESGAVFLPIVGHFAAAGKSLTEIESNVIAAYFPKYVKTPFPVHVVVAEYDTRRVSIVGAVMKPGIYSLRHDEMSLVSLLMQAGGITEKGAALIQITHHKEGTPARANANRAFFDAAMVPVSDRYDELPVRRAAIGETGAPPAAEEAMTLVLPVKGLNIPFADVALVEGDAVVVEGPQDQFISVLGLVNRPGNFPYPPTAHYRLIDAVGFAGGLNLIADPRYVSLYRLQSDGTISRMTVQLVNPKEKEHLTDVLALPVKPGDVVSVEQTLRTRTNLFFDQVFRVNLGLYFNPDDVWR